MEVWTLRRRRTEKAKEQRRLTGTNSFQDKEVVLGGKDSAPTITATQCIDNMILIYDDEETDTDKHEF